MRLAVGRIAVKRRAAMKGDPAIIAARGGTSPVCYNDRDVSSQGAVRRT